MTEKDCMGWQCHYCGNSSKDDTYCYKYEVPIEWNGVDAE